MDFWPAMTRYHKQLWYAELGRCSSLIGMPVALQIMAPAFGFAPPFGVGARVSRRATPSGPRPARAAAASSPSGTSCASPASGCSCSRWRTTSSLHFLYDPAQQNAELDHGRALEQHRPGARRTG